MRKLRLAVLISGGGTNLQAILDRALVGELPAEVVVVVSDRADAFGLNRARNVDIPTRVVDYRGYLDGRTGKSEANALWIDWEALDNAQQILKAPDPGRRRDRLRRLVLAERELIGILDEYEPDYVCLAGFMRLLTPFFVRHYNRDGGWRILNIHPALLPSFPGERGYEDTFAYGCRWGGVTVHFVDEGEDSGPIIAQAIYPLWPDDNLASVRERGLQLEYEVYSQCIRWLAAEQIAVEERSGKRPIITITDPGYEGVVKRWVEQAFSEVRKASSSVR